MLDRWPHKALHVKCRMVERLKKFVGYISLKDVRQCGVGLFGYKQPRLENVSGMSKTGEGGVDSH